MLLGTVAWYDDRRGFGFLNRDDDGDDVFVHANQVKKSGIQLSQHDRVSFNLAEHRGKPEAVDLRLLHQAREASPVPRPVRYG